MDDLNRLYDLKNPDSYSKINKLAYLKTNGHKMTASELSLLFKKDLHSANFIKTFNQLFASKNKDSSSNFGGLESAPTSFECRKNLIVVYIVSCLEKDVEPAEELTYWLAPLSTRDKIDIFDDGYLLYKDPVKKAHHTILHLSKLTNTTSYKQVRSLIDSMRVDDYELKCAFESVDKIDLFKILQPICLNDLKTLAYFYKVSEKFEALYFVELKKAIRSFSPEVAVGLLESMTPDNYESISTYITSIMSPDEIIDKFRWYMDQPKTNSPRSPYLSYLLRLHEIGVFNLEQLNNCLQINSTNLNMFGLEECTELFTLVLEKQTIEPLKTYVHSIIQSVDLNTNHWLYSKFMDRVSTFLESSDLIQLIPEQINEITELKFLSCASKQSVCVEDMDEGISYLTQKYKNSASVLSIFLDKLNKYEMVASLKKEEYTLHDVMAEYINDVRKTHYSVELPLPNLE